MTSSEDVRRVRCLVFLPSRGGAPPLGDTQRADYLGLSEERGFPLAPRLFSFPFPFRRPFPLNRTLSLFPHSSSPFFSVYEALTYIPVGGPC